MEKTRYFAIEDAKKLGWDIDFDNDVAFCSKECKQEYEEE